MISTSDPALIKIVEITRDDAALLEQFHREVYLDAFASQHEPLDVWTWALWSGEAPYTLTVRVALDDETILGGIAYEFYPRSACGLVTYIVVSAQARRAGLGKRMLAEATQALRGRGARAVFGEVNDPRIARADEPTEQAWRRLERNQRWGAHVVETRYVQPSLAPGLARDRGLLLICLDRLDGSGDTLAGTIVRAFLAEFYEVTERRAPDVELHAILDEIPDTVPLVQLAR